MLALLIVISLLAVCGMRVSPDGWLDPFCRRHTECAKGMFIGWVFVSHLWGYLDEAKVFMPGDWMAKYFLAAVGQLMVVMFLLYSGYGVTKFLMTKGMPYARDIPRRRILATLGRFDIAVLVFLVLHCFQRGFPGFGKIALSLVAWDTLGNSNWYIFAILCSYAVMWIWGLAWAGGCRFGTAALLSLIGAFGCLLAVLALVKDTYWYDTLFAFPLGCIFAAREDRLLSLARRRYWLLVAATAVVLVVLMKISRDSFGVLRNVRAMAFGTFFVLVSMKFEFVSPALQWMGRRLFPLYIYQRLPMMVFAAVGGGALIRDLPYLYVALCAGATVAIAWLYGAIGAAMPFRLRRDHESLPGATRDHETLPSATRDHENLAGRRIAQARLSAPRPISA